MKKILPVLLILVLVLVLVLVFITTRNSKFGALGGATSVDGSSGAYKYIKILFSYTNPNTSFGTNAAWNGLVLYLDKQKVAANTAITATTPATADALKSKENYISGTTDADITGSSKYGNMFFNAIGYTGFTTNIYQTALSDYYYQTDAYVLPSSKTSYISGNNSAPGNSTRYSAFVTKARSTNNLYFDYVQATYNYYTYAAPAATPPVTQPTNAAEVTALKKFTGSDPTELATSGNYTNTSNAEVPIGDQDLLRNEVFALLKFIKVFKQGSKTSPTDESTSENDSSNGFYIATDTDYETIITGINAAGTAQNPQKVNGRTLARKYMNLSTGNYLFGVAIINNRLTYNTPDRYKFPFTISDISIATVPLNIGLAPVTSTSATGLTAAFTYA